jgi:SAM-dependent methyltransferase
MRFAAHRLEAVMDKERSKQFMQKVVGDLATTLASALLYIGDRTGLFRSMAGAGPMSAEVLAGRTGIHRRYVEEWLAAMVGAGYVEYDPMAELYRLPDEHAMFLTDPGSEYYLGGLFTGLPELMAALPKLAAAFETGGGVAFAEFGAQLPVALERMNRPVYENRLVRSWLPAMPEVVARLSAGGRAIDVGCGTGVVPITIAKAFPAAEVWGLDLDERSISIARGYAEDAGVASRVRLVAGPIDAMPTDPGWDFVSTFDVVHDLPDPVGALSKIRSALADGGTYLMVEPRAADRLEDNLENPFARMLYGISCLHCVPQSLAQGGPGLGACWGGTRARELAAEAGFGRFEELPVRTQALAFYALRI